MADKPERTPDDSTARSMMSDWSATGGFFASVLAGLLLGLGGDWLLSTSPWLTVVGVVAGFGVGFWRMMEYSKKIEDEAQRAQRLRRAEPEPDDDWLD